MIRIAVLIAILCAGCSSRDSKRVPVSGHVRFSNGRPVPVGIIEFAPDNGGPTARSKITDGVFSLETNRQPGAEIGHHRVVIFQVVLADGAAAHVGAQHAKMVVHPKYAKYDSSGLSADIPISGLDDCQFTVDLASGKGW